MSVVLDQPPAAPAAPSGSLLRAELHRFRARRFIQVLLGLAVLSWLAAMVIGLTEFGNPTDAEIAQARQQIAEQVQMNNEGRQQCVDDPQRPSDVPVEEVCGPPMTEADIPLDAFLSNPPFDFTKAAENGAMGFAAAAAVLAFIVGATWIGAEWSTRNLVALLFWQPRRYRVMATKIGVLVLAAALFGALAQAAWLGMAGTLSAVAGNSSTQPPGFWGDLLATQGRGVLLVVLAALGGFGLTNLVRNTGAALGADFVYFAVVETAILALQPSWQPWLLTNNAIALLVHGGFTVYVPGGTVDPSGFSMGREYVITNLQGGILLGSVGAVIVAVGVVLFAKRDLH
jgi:hypothetical protein